MKIAIIGAGAIGSVVAGYLTKAGISVLLVGRRDQVEAIRQQGLKIKKFDGTEDLISVPVATELDREYDLTIFSVKTQDMEAAYQQNYECLPPLANILSIQNGVQADNILSSHFEPEKIISSIVMFGATYIQPGEVTLNFPGDWIIGKPFSANGTKVTDVEEVLSQAFSVYVTGEIVGMKWLKLFVNFNNCLPALVGKSMQETFSDMELCKLSVMLLREGVDVVENAGIELVSLPKFPVEKIKGLSSLPIDQAAGIIHKTLTTLSQEPLYGSILQSIMRKKQSEIDFINGEVALLASHTGKKSPLNRKVVDLVHRVEQGGKFFTPQEVKKEFSLN